MSSMSFQDQQETAPRVCLGKIATAHGVRGLVKILVYGEDAMLLEELQPLYTSEHGKDTITLKMKNSAGKYWLAEIEGINDRTQAEKLRGTELWVNRELLPETIVEDEFYITDLVGMMVKDTNGNAIGNVIDVKNFGAGDLVEIKPERGESFFVPFTKEAVPDITDKAVIVSADTL